MKGVKRKQVDLYELHEQFSLKLLSMEKDIKELRKMQEELAKQIKRQVTPPATKKIWIPGEQDEEGNTFQWYENDGREAWEMLQ